MIALGEMLKDVLTPRAIRASLANIGGESFEKADEDARTLYVD